MEGESPYRGVAFRRIDIEICHVDPKQRFCITDFEVPANWSYSASEMLVRYYVCKREVPSRLLYVSEEGVPKWLRRSVMDKDTLLQMPMEEHFGPETSAKQVFHRLAGAWAYWGYNAGYFDSEDDVKAFYDECCYMLANQMVSPASPQWLNTGLHWAYGIAGDASGHFYVDSQTGKIEKSSNAYERPQHHHCFIQGVKDELVSDGGIMDLWEREVRAFKYGSGAGCNMSAIRSSKELLSGGDHAVGLMRFLSIGDKAAAAIKSGGRGLKLDKLALIDIDHPDIEKFICWKAEEEHKAAALITGARQLRKHLSNIIEAAKESVDKPDYSPEKNLKLKRAIIEARRAMLPESYIVRVLDYLRQDITEITIPVYGTEEDSDVFLTVGAHQAKLAVRVSDYFLNAAESQIQWALRSRDGRRTVDVVDASDLLDGLTQATWATGDPSVQFDDAIQAWHGCAQEGRIAASSPHGEFLFLDDTACDVASMNLLAFTRDDHSFDVETFEHAVRTMTIMLDISISMAQFPSRDVAANTYRYRPIGLSHCNLAALLMQMGYAYDSDEGRAIASAVTAIMTGTGYAVSAEMAKELGAFEAFVDNREDMLRLIHRHHEAVHGRTQYLGSIHVMPAVLDHSSLPDSELGDAAQRIWDRAVILGDESGFSNAQISVLALSPNAARLMDADSLSAMPEHGVVKYAAQAQGTFRKYVPKHVTAGLQALGYNQSQIADIARYCRGYGTLHDAPVINHEQLRAVGFTDALLSLVEEVLPHAMHINMAFDPFVLGDSFCRDVLGLEDLQIYDANFDLLAHIGFSAEDIETANEYACGKMAFEGAPHVCEEDMAVFDGVMSNSSNARFVSVESQVLMMSSLQSFVSGGIAHKIIIPTQTKIQQCRVWTMAAWRMGLKSLSLYRMGCGLQDRINMREEDAVTTESAEEPEEAVAMDFRVSSPQLLAVEMAKYYDHMRRELPLRRGGFTQKASIGGQTLYLHTGEYEDGSLGEIFIEMPKQSPYFRQLVNHFAVAISIALQHGVPLEEFVDAFRSTQFDPSGHVEGSEYIDTATSILDYVFRELAVAYLPMSDDVEQEEELQIIPDHTESDMDDEIPIMEVIGEEVPPNKRVQLLDLNFSISEEDV